MLRRSACLALFVGAAAALLLAGPASAQTANPNSNYQGCQAFVSDVSVVPGQTITVTGSGANGADGVSATISGTAGAIGSGTADATGNFSFPATVPVTSALGRHTLAVTCGPDGGVAEIMITISASGAGTGPVTTISGGVAGAGTGQGSTGAGSLSKTGADHLILLVKVGVVLVATGGLVLAADRRRRWARRPALTD